MSSASITLHVIHFTDCAHRPMPGPGH